MKLWYSPASPFARKCLITAHELGIDDQIELLDAAAHPITRDENIARSNPLAKVPTMLLEDGHVLFDSSVICSYLDDQHKGEKIIPENSQEEPMRRYNALVTQTIGDGMMEAAVLIRYEQGVRPPEKQWDAWIEGQFKKIETSLEYLEYWRAARLQDIHIGSIAVAAALGYLDFRQPQYDWRKDRPVLKQMFETFSKRKSMKATQPSG